MEEAWSWITGRTPGFTRERVGYASRHRYFNVEKARHVLGYEPDVGLLDGIRLSAKVSHLYNSLLIAKY